MTTLRFYFSDPASSPYYVSVDTTMDEAITQVRDFLANKSDYYLTRSDDRATFISTDKITFIEVMDL